MRMVMLTITVAFLGACASNSGVRDIGGDTYFVSRQAATGFSGMGTLRADAMGEAASHCARQGRIVEIVSEDQSDPPYIFGNFPRAEITFRCVERG